MQTVYDAVETPPFQAWPEGAEILKHVGGCHCGKFRFEFEHPSLEARPPVDCNCSLCTKRGELHLYGDESRFTLTEGSWDEFSVYEWGKKRVKKLFCPVCGCSVLWKGMGKVGINARALDNFESSKIDTRLFDGKKRL